MPEPPVEPTPAAGRRSLPRLLGLLPVLVVAGLVAAAIVLAVQLRANTAADSRRQAVLQAARTEAVNLTTISYRTADRDLTRIIDAATGALRADFVAQRTKFPAALRKDKSVSRGTVLAAGVVSLSRHKARVLVAVDASVTSGGGGQPVVKHYRMAVDLVPKGSRWLVANVAFAGVPQ